MSFSPNDRKKIKSEIEYDVLHERQLDELAHLILSMNDEPSNLFQYRSFSRDYYHWMYFRNPAGRATVYRACHRGNLVSSFAMAPKRIQIGSKVITCGKTMDMFTHPDYQGLGLIKKVTSLVFDATRKAGINIWYVTPSNDSYPIFLKKWGYKESFQLIYRAKFLQVTPILEKFLKPAFLGKLSGWPVDMILRSSNLFSSLPAGYEVQEETEFGPETDELWKMSNKDKVALIRDSFLSSSLLIFFQVGDRPIYPVGINEVNGIFRFNNSGSALSTTLLYPSSKVIII